MASLADHGEYRGGEGNGSMRTPFARMALWDGPWRMGYHMGCAAFVLTLNDFPHPFWNPPPASTTTIFVDFCNESDTPPDRVSGADFPKRFSPLLSFIADVREKQFLSPNLERSRREIKAAAVAVVGASLMIRGMDRVWRAR